MRRWALALLLLWVATASADAQALDATLISSRWPGLSLSYPATLFGVIRPEDVTGKDTSVASVADVDELRTKDGTIEVTLGGEYNNGGTFNDAAGFAEQWVKDLAVDKKSDAVSVSYRAHKGSWAVISGVVGDKVFYLRVVARCEHGARRCDEPETFASAQCFYPKENHARFDALVAAMSATLTPAVTSMK